MANPDDQVTIDRRMERFSCDSFDKDKMTWDAYIFQFEQMCRAKSLGGAGPNATAARRTLLLAYVGPEALAAVRHQFYPDDVNTKGYNEVKEALVRLYKPSLTIFSARLAFEKATRREVETMTQFANRLRELSVVCNYGNALDERLRDRFAAGANHSKFEVELRQRWPDGQQSNEHGALVALAFQTVYELAVAMERAENECRSQAGDNTHGRTVDANGKAAEVNAMKGSKAKWSGTCPRCGRVDHHAGFQCRHRGTKCFKCGNVGHLAKMCQEDTSSEAESVDEASHKKAKSPRQRAAKSNGKGYARIGGIYADYEQQNEDYDAMAIA